jgi:outer membrane protein OmpA-like peptidoglycan-associated protein
MIPGGPWQGFYTGLNIGGAWLDANGTQNPMECLATVDGCGLKAGGVGASRSFSRSLNASKPLGGSQAGYNTQVSPQWVLVLETDLVNSSTNRVFSLAPPLSGSATVHSSASQDLLGTVRRRVGLAPIPDLLLFGTGGFAYGEQSGSAIIQPAADAYKSGAPVRLQVTGSTDRSSSPGYNQRLSERRAPNVAKALAALGVSRDQMIVAGCGENGNRVPTANGVREQQNRRVEITS